MTQRAIAPSQNAGLRLGESVIIQMAATNELSVRIFDVGGERSANCEPRCSPVMKDDGTRNVATWKCVNPSRPLAHCVVYWPVLSVRKINAPPIPLHTNV